LAPGGREGGRREERLGLWLDRRVKSQNIWQAEAAGAWRAG
jgi:hypothetical protein